MTGSGLTSWSVTNALVDALKTECEVQMEFIETSASATAASYVANAEANAATTFTASFAEW